MVSPEERQAVLDRTVGSPARLAAALRTAMLDTPQEETFDALSRLAAALIGTPVSFLSIVAEDRDFYKSQSGFPEPLALSRELFGRSFCHYAIVSPEPLAIGDTYAHPLWRSVPTVLSLGVRAYLGVPIIVDGEAIGSFCVIDQQPRTWTTIEIETLRQIAKSAEREISLRSALRGANELARKREELLAVVAHDLRTPIQVISLNASLIGRLAEPPVQPHVNRVTIAVESMKRLVEDLLSTHAIENQPSRQEPMAAAKLLRDALDTMLAVAERAQIELSMAPDPMGIVFVDYSHMLRVLCNLLGNCVKYCPAGCKVLLGAIEDGEVVLITVADDGPGMSAGDQAHAFERGWQGSNGQARQDGAGLGLAIVRQLVEQNAGHVSIAAQAGQGTSVSIRLPRHR